MSNAIVFRYSHNPSVQMDWCIATEQTQDCIAGEQQEREHWEALGRKVAEDRIRRVYDKLLGTECQSTSG